jgi:hypothetical protein
LHPRAGAEQSSAIEILYKLAKVLRYPRVVAIHGLPETQIHDFVEFLREN